MSSKKTIKAEVSFDDIYENYITQIEQKTKLTRKQIYIALLVAFAFFLIGRLEIIITYIITVYFPVKWTIESFKSKDEDFFKMWGSYWIVFGCFVVLDIFHKYFIYYIPLYFFIRTISLLWLFLPCFQGGIIFYNVVFVELLKISYFFRAKRKENETMLQELLKKKKLKTE